MNLAAGELLNKRYQILYKLGEGGFGQTFLAEDQHLPGQQKCVVKQLKPQATDPFTLQTARRLFETEAETLYQLGNHPQIPRLFAYFEENQEFYLVQEYIEGKTLSQELPPSGSKKTETEVVELLKEILEVLEFVHQNKVIHRDINPNNIIRRNQDSKLILIDFGAVKQLSTQIGQPVTVGIGTPGYHPAEQAKGAPQLSSDIYAVGMVAIQALTGYYPHQLPIDNQTGEIIWQDQVEVSPALARVLNKMIRYDFRERYTDAKDALEAVQDLTSNSQTTVALQGIQPPLSTVINPQKTRAFLTIIVGVIVVSIVGFFGTMGVRFLLNNANASELYKRAVTLTELKRYQEALQTYEKALAIRPDYPEALNGKGDVLQALKRYQDALIIYEEAIELQPQDWDAWIGRAECFSSLQRYQNAIEAFNSALKINPNAWQAWQGLGNVYLKLNKYAEAINAFDKMFQWQPNQAWSWYQKGWAYQNLKDYDNALKSYNKAVELKGDLHQAWYQKANVLMNLKRYQDAADAYDKAVQFNPTLSQAWYSRGIALIQLRKYDLARDSFEQAIKNNPNYYEAWYQKGWALHQLKNYEEAIKSYQKAAQIKPNYYAAWYNQANLFYLLEKYPEALTAYDRSVQLRKDAYDAWYSRGNTLVKLGRYTEAIDSYDQALKYKSDYREAQKQKDELQKMLEKQQSDPNKNNQLGVKEILKNLGF